GVRAGNAGLRQFAQSSFGTLGSRRHCRERLRVGSGIFAVLFLELGRNVIDDAVVPVFSAQADVSLDRQGFKPALGQTNQRDVESSAAKIVDEHRAFFVWQNSVRGQIGGSVGRLKGISQRRGGRLVDDIDHFQTGDSSGILRRLAARIVKVGRNG